MSGTQPQTDGAGGRPAAGTRPIFHPYLLLAFRVVLAAVFVYAGVQKLGKPLAFADAIHAYGVVGYGPPLYILAVVLPWIEIFCGLCLLTGVYVRGAALLLLCMNALFLAVIAYRTAGFLREGTPFFKVYFSCGCGFGPTYAWKKLIEDAAYLVMSAVLLCAPRHRFTLSGWRR